MKEWKEGVAFVSGEWVGGIVARLEEFIYCRKQSLGVGEARVYEVRVVGGPGGVEGILVLLEVICKSLEINS